MQTFDVAEAAAFLKVSRETLLGLADSGDIPGAKVGRSWVFADEDLYEYLRAQVRDQTAQRREIKIAPSPRTGKVLRVATGYETGVRDKKQGRAALLDLDSLEPQKQG
jgi:excisionase family DNA binding protein